MKQLSRTFRLSTAMAAALMMTAEAAGAPSAPAAPAAPTPKPLTAAQQKKADEKAAKELKKQQDKEAKEKAAAEKAAAAPAPKDEKNGVTRPASGKTLRVWEKADEMSKALKAPIGRKELTDALLAEGLVVGTIHTQYGKWRKYHGLTAEKAASAPAAPAAPEAPAA